MTRTASLLACLAILACAFAALGGSLHGGFVWDDRPLILDNPGVKDPAMLPSIFTSGSGRPATVTIAFGPSTAPRSS